MLVLGLGRPQVGPNPFPDTWGSGREQFGVFPCLFWQVPDPFWDGVLSKYFLWFLKWLFSPTQGLFPFRRVSSTSVLHPFYIRSTSVLHPFYINFLPFYKSFLPFYKSFLPFYKSFLPFYKSFLPFYKSSSRSTANSSRFEVSPVTFQRGRSQVRIRLTVRLMDSIGLKCTAIAIFVRCPTFTGGTPRILPTWDPGCGEQVWA